MHEVVRVYVQREYEYNMCILLGKSTGGILVPCCL
jgi:hypothetical protein